MNKEKYLEAVIELLHYATYNANRVEKKELNENAKILKQLINDYFDKETPKKVTFLYSNKFPYCPCCDNPFIVSTDNYCSKCGQKLDWGNKCF